MRYRIKIKTYKNGRKEYIPQVKLIIGWAQIDFWGDACFLYNVTLSNREEALQRIDNHYNGNTKKLNIEFEYIDK